MAWHVRSALLAAVTLVLIGATAAPAAAASTLEIFPDPWVLLIQIVFFLLLIWPANRLLWRPLLRVMDERRERIDGLRERSAKVESNADEVFDRYQEAVNGARSAAESDYKERLSEARREQGRVTNEARASAEEEIGAARAEVESAFEAARGELRDRLTGIARSAASRTLGRELS